MADVHAPARPFAGWIGRPEKAAGRCYAGDAFRTRPVSRLAAVPPMPTLRAALDELAAGLDGDPLAPLPPSAGILAGMRPAFVACILAPLAVAVLATWGAALAGV